MGKKRMSEPQPLSWQAACRLGRRDVVEQLIAHGLDPAVRDEYGHTALMMSCCVAPAQPGQSMRVTERQASLRAVDLVRWLLTQPGVAAGINAQSIEGRSALFWAARDRPELVAVLLDAGATPDIRDTHGEKARDWARRGGHLVEVEKLFNAWRLARARMREGMPC